MTQGLENFQSLHFTGMLLTKVYNVPEEFGKFSREQSKVSKLGLYWDHFMQSRKCMSLKVTWELRAMAMKNDAKFEEQLTCQFKIDIKNLTNLTRVLENRKNVNFHCFWPKYITFELRRYRGAIFNGTEYYAKFEGKLTCAFKNGMRNLAIFDPSTQKSPIFAL